MFYLFYVFITQFLSLLKLVWFFILFYLHIKTNITSQKQPYCRLAEKLAPRNVSHDDRKLEKIGALFITVLWTWCIDIDCVVCRLNYLLAGGLHPVGFHVLNIGLHCVISALMIDVFTILIAGFASDGKAKRLAHFPKASVLAALFFAAHPVHTESVSR